jgi:HEAT repeat protein
MKALLIALGTVGLLLAASATAPAASKEEEVVRYIKDLKSKDPATRRIAAEEIGKIGQVKASAAKPAVQPLLGALKDKDEAVREAAATALSRLDEPAEVVPALVKLLKDDKKMKVRVAAANGLGLMGEAAREALPALREIRKDAMAAGRAQQPLTQATGQAIQQIQGRKKK